jgi:hypothetical protein
VRDSGSAIEVEAAWFVGCGLSRRGVQRVEGGDVFLLAGTGAAHRQLHPPHADRDHRADLQQLQPDGVGTGAGKTGVFNPMRRSACIST